MSDPVNDLKQELLAAADRQRGHAAMRPGRLRGHSGRNRLLLAAATLPIAAAVAALFFAAPWTDSPGFLERAHAALTPDVGTILHQKWELTSTSTDPACTVTRGPNEIWIDQTPPHRYRVVLNDLPPDPRLDPRVLVCSRGTAFELGGALDKRATLLFVPPKTLTFSPVHFVFPLDPVADLREAISAGRAHDEGTMQLEGRTVERIRIDPLSPCPSRVPSVGPGCRRGPIYVYVDPETFYPVQTDCSDCGAIALPGRPVVRLQMVFRTLTFEYLPRTAANLALTDIRAQHPKATVP